VASVFANGSALGASLKIGIFTLHLLAVDEKGIHLDTRILCENGPRLSRIFW
jgi:hypothetical protein